MTGYIYKITNTVNNKSYVGQTIRTLEIRWHKHIVEATADKPLKTKFARAIRKYGAEAFKPELIEILENCTVDELTEREFYWIHKLDSINTGYNSSDARCRSGGNTYRGKSEAEMAAIKAKIAATKFGGKNPNARKVKILDTFTNEIFHFETAQQATDYLGESQHARITERCSGKTRTLLNGRYNIAYEEDEFDLSRGSIPFNYLRKSITVVEIFEDKETSYDFTSFTEAEKYFGWPRGTINRTIKCPIEKRRKYSNYKFIIE